ncbi:MAG: T9SS type A sorting domain-containing protein [Bacteroidota bacterium]
MRLLLPLLLLALALPAVAQITITRADVEARFGTEELSFTYDFESEVPDLAVLPDTTGLSVIARSDGANQSWNMVTMLSTLALVDRRRFVPVPPDADPFDFEGLQNPWFGEANTNAVLRLGARRDLDESPDSMSSLYYRFDAEGGWNTGFAVGDLDIDQDGSLDTLVTRRYHLGAPEIRFPTELGAMWTESFVDSSAIFVPNFGVIDSENQRSTIVREVDGWGTLVTPRGAFQALRLRLDQTTDLFPLGDSPGDAVLKGYGFVTREGESAVVLWRDNFPQDDPDAVLETITYFQSVGSVANEADTPQPAGLALEAHPNPARDAATLAVTLAAAGPVTLAVYDLLGRRVALVHDGRLAAGTHALLLDTARLPSGLYLARLVHVDQAVTRRLVVQR